MAELKGDLLSFERSSLATIDFYGLLVLWLKSEAWFLSSLLSVNAGLFISCLSCAYLGDVSNGGERIFLWCITADYSSERAPLWSESSFGLQRLITDSCR